MVPGDISEGICAERKRPLQWAPDPGQQNKAPIPFLLLKEGTPTGWIPLGLRFSLRLFLRFSNLEACFFLKPPRIQKRHPGNVRPWHLVARRHHVVVIHILDKGPWNIDAVLFPLLKIKGGDHQSAHHGETTPKPPGKGGWLKNGNFVGINQKRTVGKG